MMAAGPVMARGGVDLLLLNARVVTLAAGCPRAQAVAVSGGRIAAVGSDSELRALTGRRSRLVDCRGNTLLPGFNDAHLHLPGLAARLLDLDCSPAAAPSLAALQELVRREARRQPPGAWVRGRGYDHLALDGRRHPRRRDLDAAAPGHPVRLEHRSGHAAVLNTRALELAGIHRETPDPDGGVIERDPGDGEPTGLLLDCGELLRQRLGQRRSKAELADGLRRAGQLLASYGITSVQDAGAGNGPERWHLFAGLRDSGALPQRITLMAGAARLPEFAAAGLEWGSGDDRLHLGHAKIMLTLTAGALSPPPEELREIIAAAHRRGFPVALHCIEQEAVAAAVAALAAAAPIPARFRPARPTDRIEHCAEGPPPLVEAVRRGGAMVVTQPGFIYHRGTVYRRETPPELRLHLYPAGALRRQGVAVAFSSDAPVIDPNPWPAVYSAATGRAGDGASVGGDDGRNQAVGLAAALRGFTLDGATAEGRAAVKGRIAPGQLADLTLLDANLDSLNPELLPYVKPRMTIIGGEMIWQAPGE